MAESEAQRLENSSLMRSLEAPEAIARARLPLCGADRAALARGKARAVAGTRSRAGRGGEAV